MFLYNKNTQQQVYMITVLIKHVYKLCFINSYGGRQFVELARQGGEKYTTIQKMWINDSYDPNFDEKISLDLKQIEPSVAGPKRPQDKILVRDIPAVFKIPSKQK